MSILNEARRAWPRVEQLLPSRPEPAQGFGGRPRVPDEQAFYRLVLFLRAGCSWSVFDALLAGSGVSGSTCRRRLREWRRAGVFERLAREMIGALPSSSNTEYVDASFIRARGGGDEIGLTRHGKGCKLQLSVDREGLPTSWVLAPANVGETRLVGELLARRARSGRPATLSGDRAYSSDRLARKLAEFEIKLLALPQPTYTNVRRDLRGARSSRRARWRVERTFAWLASFRRVTTRWEPRAGNYPLRT